MIQVAVKNHSSVVPDAEVRAALPSFQTQVGRDFAPIWGASCELLFVEKKKPTPPGAWLLGIFDHADQAGALGYHDLTKAGLPLGKVFAKTTAQYGGLWTVTFSHELLEMLADPDINLCALDEKSNRFYAYEVCDATEADELGYTIGKVQVSDFVLPGWFEPNHVAKGERFAFKSDLARPFELAPGGYASVLDVRVGSWQQLTARKPGRLTKATQESRPQVGSRRERRRTGAASWLRSTAA